MQKVISYYNSFDEWGRLEREPLEFKVNLHHIIENLPEHGHVLDNGAGPGKYALELAKLGYQITLTDLTTKLVDIAKQKAEDQVLTKQFNGFYTTDARDLSQFSDNQFDAALMLGPLYHLQIKEDRSKAISELHRVTKPGGIVFVAFMSRTRFLTTSIMHPEFWKPNHTADGIEEFLQTGKFDHNDEGRFTGAYYFNIEDINPFMESHGFTTKKLIGSGSVAGAMNQDQWDYWEKQEGNDFNRIMKIIYKESENPYIFGASSHLLYIGMKDFQ